MTSVVDRTHLAHFDNEFDEIERNDELAHHHRAMAQNVVLASFENAAGVSPYRLNPSYRRPVGGDSDHGYSTMTPHDDSEHLGPPYIEPLLLNKTRQPTYYQPSVSDSYSRCSSPISSAPPMTSLLSKIGKVSPMGPCVAQVQVHCVESQ